MVKHPKYKDAPVISKRTGTGRKQRLYYLCAACLAEKRDDKLYRHFRTKHKDCFDILNLEFMKLRYGWTPLYPKTQWKGKLPDDWDSVVTEPILKNKLIN